jgi:predicted dehydrogenase
MREEVSLAVVSPARVSALAQAFSQMTRVRVTWLCTTDTRTQSIFGTPPGTVARTTSEFERVLEDDHLDAVAFDLDVASRGEWPRRALLAEKHVFVTGALAATSAEVEALAAAAHAGGRRLRGYLPAVFSGGAAKLRTLISRGTLGEILYLRGSVTGQSSPEVDLLLDAAPDLVGLILDLLGDQPIDVTARSDAYVHPYGADTIDAHLGFATGIAAQLHLSRVDSRRSERLTVVGSRLTATLDWTLPNGLALHGGARGPRSDDLLDGGMIVPPIPLVDPLRSATEDFLTSIRSNAEYPVSADATAVVQVLDAIRSACAEPAGADDHRDDAAIVELHAR